MGNFNRDRRGGDRSFGRRDFRGGGDRQSAAIAGRNAKFLLNPLAVSLFTAVIVLKNSADEAIDNLPTDQDSETESRNSIKIKVSLML